MVQCFWVFILWACNGLTVIMLWNVMAWFLLPWLSSFLFEKLILCCWRVEVAVFRSTACFHLCNYWFISWRLDHIVSPADFSCCLLQLLFCLTVVTHNSTIMLFHHLACIETSKSWAYLTMSLLHTKVLGKSWLVVAEGVLYSNHKTIIAVLINDLNLHI